MPAYEYVVDLPEQPGGPEPELRERFVVNITRRLGKLEDQGTPYPAAGDSFDILDAFEGPYVWEMTPAELEATPPSSVQVEVVAVDPVEPAGSGPVRVTVRIPF